MKLWSYGVEAGIRYQINENWDVNASLRYMQFQKKNDTELNTTSFSIGAGYRF